MSVRTTTNVHLRNPEDITTRLLAPSGVATLELGEDVTVFLGNGPEKQLAMIDKLLHELYTLSVKIQNKEFDRG